MEQGGYMKILMLGWEYPPHISGGLGTACEGLTRALAARGTYIDFILPKVFGDEGVKHMNLVSSDSDQILGGPDPNEISRLRSERIRTEHIDSLLSPYLNEVDYETIFKEWQEKGMPDHVLNKLKKNTPASNDHYGANLFEEVSRFANRVVSLTFNYDFDLIHAHDWMTMPAGLALKRLTNKKLVVQFHSLESDRSGRPGNSRIVEIERQVAQEADLLIAVSHYTSRKIHEDYGVPFEKIRVVHNGIYPKERGPNTLRRKKQPGEPPVVLFLGRVVFQKGPDYFVEAAAKVLRVIPQVKFVIAGSGGMLPQVLEQIQSMGITDKFEFRGFLKGDAVDEAFANADVYVMPSVSEPFGITALEALSLETPVILSRQSGVSEVLNHILKCDFWDTERLANYIIGAIKYPEMRRDLVSMAGQEIKTVCWELAADKALKVYEEVLKS